MFGVFIIVVAALLTITGVCAFDIFIAFSLFWVVFGTCQSESFELDWWQPAVAFKSSIKSQFRKLRICIYITTKLQRCICFDLVEKCSSLVSWNRTRSIKIGTFVIKLVSRILNCFKVNFIRDTRVTHALFRFVFLNGLKIFPISTIFLRTLDLQLINNCPTYTIHSKPEIFSIEPFENPAPSLEYSKTFLENI